MVRQCPISFVRRFSASPWRFSPSWWRSPWVGSERADRRWFRHSFQFAQNRALLRWRARFSALRGESGAGWAAGREMKAAVRRRGQNGVWESGQSALENDFGEGRCSPASVGYGAVGGWGRAVRRRKTAPRPLLWTRGRVVHRWMSQVALGRARNSSASGSVNTLVNSAPLMVSWASRYWAVSSSWGRHRVRISSQRA